MQKGSDLEVKHANLRTEKSFKETNFVLQFDPKYVINPASLRCPGYVPTLVHLNIEPIQRGCGALSIAHSLVKLELVLRYNLFGVN